ncbi:MAG: aminotransferase class V-fold PLP-dependent enzyme [Gammaproteobacteria bacterium]|jgi:selenocysteine lyase/cysteine desulfurase
MYEHEFDLSDDICYLNHAAVAPWPRRTVSAVERFARENGRFGARHYEAWLQTERQLRERICRLINATGPDEIALLKNTSEALSVVSYGLEWRAGDEVVITDQEFPSNRIVWQSLAPFGVKVVETDITRADAPEAAIIAAMSPRTRLVSVSSVQYASGLALDLEVLGAACHDRDVAFCIDAIQSIGVKPLDVQGCRADFVMADGHKWMLGPEGLALFYCRRDWIPRLSLRQFGWHMVEASGDYDSRTWRPAESARRFECGSPNMLGIHALHASLGLLLEAGIDHVFHEVRANVQRLVDGLHELEAEFLSPLEVARRAGVVTFRLPGCDQAGLFRRLQDAGVVCALRGGGIRFSPHFYTPRRVLDRAVEITIQASKSQ